MAKGKTSDLLDSTANSSAAQVPEKKKNKKENHECESNLLFLHFGDFPPLTRKGTVCHAPQLLGDLGRHRRVLLLKQASRPQHGTAVALK